MKAYYRLLGITFIIFVFGVFIANIISPVETFSELENRVLAKAPKLSVDNLIEGRYSSKFEKYINDQFVMRANLVTLKSSADLILGKVENNGVYKGDDNSLFEDVSEPNTQSLDENIKAINAFVDKHKEIKSTFMLVANSSTVLKDKLPENAPIIDGLEYINSFGEKLSKEANFISPYDTLMDNKDEYLYYKTDHHWTTLGAYYAYTDYCKSKEITPKSLDAYKKVLVSSDFYGTLFSKSLFKRDKGDEVYTYIPTDDKDQAIVEYTTEKEKSPSLYASDYLAKRDKYGMFLKGNHPVVKIQTTAKLKDERKLLILKDSYANSFVPFLTSHFTEITLIDPRYYYEDIEELIKQEGYTDVLFLYNANTFFQDNSLSGVIGDK